MRLGLPPRPGAGDYLLVRSNHAGGFLSRS